MGTALSKRAHAFILRDCYNVRCSCSSANLGSCSSFFFTALPLSTFAPHFSAAQPHVMTAAVFFWSLDYLKNVSLNS